MTSVKEQAYSTGVMPVRCGSGVPVDSQKDLWNCSRLLTSQGRALEASRDYPSRVEGARHPSRIPETCPVGADTAPWQGPPEPP